MLEWVFFAGEITVSFLHLSAHSITDLRTDWTIVVHLFQLHEKIGSLKTYQLSPPSFKIV